MGDRLSILVEDVCIRLGMEGFLYGSRAHVVRIQQLMLHSGSMDWWFDVQLKADSLCIISHESQIILGELDLPTVHADINAVSIVNMVVRLFARQIKDMIPALVEKALANN